MLARYQPAVGSIHDSGTSCWRQPGKHSR